MAIDHSIESKIHRRAALLHQACSELHLKASELIDNNSLEQAKTVAQEALGCGTQAHSSTLAACVADMAVMR